MGWVADITAARDAGGDPITQTRQVASDVMVQNVPVRYVPDDPADLLEAARERYPDLTGDQYALARMLSAEGYHGAAAGWPAAMVAMAASMINAAGPRGAGDLLRASTYGRPLDGHYGEQIGRRASTAKDPKPEHVLAARVAARERALARSARTFFDPYTQAAGVQAGRQIKTPERIIRAWHGFVDEDPDATARDREKYRGYTLAFIGRNAIPSLDPYFLMLLRHEPSDAVRRLAMEEALDVVRRGRQGKEQAAPGSPDGRGWGPLAAALAVALVTS